MPEDPVVSVEVGQDHLRQYTVLHLAIHTEQMRHMDRPTFRRALAGILNRLGDEAMVAYDKLHADD